MKRRFLSAALAVLIMLAILPGHASADALTNLGQTAAGAPMNSLIGRFGAGVVPYCDALPQGCELQTLVGGDSLFLGGTPELAGYYQFTVQLSDAQGADLGSVECSLTVTPAVPALSTSGSVNCYVGDGALLSVAASVSDGGTLSYQWYASLSAANVGGAAITGANYAEYSPDTSRIGTSYYYCEVTNSGGGMVSSAVSPVFAVNVTQAVVQSVMVNSMPQKTRYSVGESLDTTGISLLVTYGNGTQHIVYDGYEFTPSVFSTPGTVAVELAYGGRRCSFPVTVISEEDSLEGIGMVTLPNKTAYQQGDSLDPTGIIFRAYYSDGSYRDIDSDYTYSPRQLNSSGTQTITVSYKNKTCTFTVTVAAVQTTSTLEIASTPRKLSYELGDTLDTSGMVLKLSNSTGSQIINSGFTCEPSTLTAAGKQTVRVRYGDYTATFTVTVSALASPSPSASATPSASPSAAVTSPAVSAQPAPAKSDRRVNTVLLIAMFVALFALIGLGLYMLIMNAGGVEQFKNQVEYRLYKLKSRFRRRQ